MSNQPLRLEQYGAVLYNANLNPMGVPDSVIKALGNNLDAVIRYPEDYHSNLKSSIANYTGCEPNHIILANGSSHLLHKFIRTIAPKKAMILTPTFSEYEKVLKIYGCEVCFYQLDESKNYEFDLMDFVTKLDSSIDMIIINNPNNPTSQIISRDDLDTLAEVCKELEAFLVVDEMYIEFTEDYDNLTCVPLVKNYDNLVILRSISKFFAVPGLRLGYAIISNQTYIDKMNALTELGGVSSLTAAACTQMFKDKEYIIKSRLQIHTERSLIYSAMSTSKKVQLFKPYANFMLVKLLDENVTADKVAENCNLKGIVIRNCENIKGLSNKYIRFCFMKPEQNDLLVNTILELV